MSARLIKQELFLYEKFGDMVNLDGKNLKLFMFIEEIFSYSLFPISIIYRTLRKFKKECFLCHVN